MLDGVNQQPTPSTNSLEDYSTAAPRAFKEEGTPEGVLSCGTSLSKLTLDTEDGEDGDNAVSLKLGLKFWPLSTLNCNFFSGNPFQFSAEK